MLDKWALWDWERYRVQDDSHNFTCDHGSGWSCCLCLLEERLLSALFSNSLPSSSLSFCKANTILSGQQWLRHFPRNLLHSIPCMLHLPKEREHWTEGPTLLNPSFLHHFYSKGLPVYHDSSISNINSKKVLQVKKLSCLLPFQCLQNIQFMFSHSPVL